MKSEIQNCFFIIFTYNVEYLAIISEIMDAFTYLNISLQLECYVNMFVTL